MIQNKKIARRYAKAFLHDNLGKDEIDVLTNEIMSFVMALESDEKAREFFINPVSSEVSIETKCRVARNVSFSVASMSNLENDGRITPK